MLNITRLDSGQSDFWSRLEALTAWEEVSDDQVLATVREVLQQVRTRGDAALLDYTRRFDRWQPAAAGDLAISKARLQQAFETVPAAQRQALQEAAERIRTYAEHQKMASWSIRRVSTTRHISTSCCQSRLLRAKRDTSRAATAPTLPKQTSATMRSKPERITAPAAERPRSS